MHEYEDEAQQVEEDDAADVDDGRGWRVRVDRFELYNNHDGLK